MPHPSTQPRAPRVRTGRSGRAAARENLDFFGAPHAAFLFVPAFGDGVRAAGDIGMYAQNFLLSLTARGLGGTADHARHYSAADGPSAPVAQALVGLTRTPATARVTAAQLIIIHRDHRMYEWETYATLPLGSRGRLTTV